jgi:hypothetical protein
MNMESTQARRTEPRMEPGRKTRRKKGMTEGGEMPKGTEGWNPGKNEGLRQGKKQGRKNQGRNQETHQFGWTGSCQTMKIKLFVG